MSALVGPYSLPVGMCKLADSVETVKQSQSSKPGFREKDESDDEEGYVHSPGSVEWHDLDFLVSKKDNFF